MEFSITKKGYSPKEVEEYIAAIKREYESTVLKQRDRIRELLEQNEAAESELNSFREKSSQISKAIVSAVSKAEEIERLSRLKYNQEIARLKEFHEKWTKYYNRLLDEYPLDERLTKAGEFNRRMDKILSRVKSKDDSDAQKQSGEGDDVRIGYINVKAEQSGDDTSISDLLPDADPDSPVLTGNFDPMERIKRYFAAEREREREKESGHAAEKSDKQKQTVPPAHEQSAAAQSDGKKDYSDRSPSGFSFEEALNPTEDLESILKDLGLFSCD